MISSYNAVRHSCLVRAKLCLVKKKKKKKDNPQKKSCINKCMESQRWKKCVWVQNICLHTGPPVCPVIHAKSYEGNFASSLHVPSKVQFTCLLLVSILNTQKVTDKNLVAKLLNFSLYKVSWKKGENMWEGPFLKLESCSAVWSLTFKEWLLIVRPQFHFFLYLIVVWQDHMWASYRRHWKVGWVVGNCHFSFCITDTFCCLLFSQSNNHPLI